MRHDDMDERSRKLGVNVGPVHHIVPDRCCLCDRNWLVPVLAVALPTVDIVHF